jgi:hypothetical protein
MLTMLAALKTLKRAILPYLILGSLQEMAVAVLDRESRYLYVNLAAARLMQRQMRQLL